MCPDGLFSSLVTKGDRTGTNVWRGGVVLAEYLLSAAGGCVGVAPTDDGIIVPPGLVARSLEGAKVVEIGAGVTVVGKRGHIVFQQGIQPDSGKTHIGNVIQVIRNSLDITAMPAVRITALDVVSHSLDIVVACIAI